MGNDNKINIWHDIWMEDSPLFDKVIDGKENYVNHEAKVSEFIDSTKRWQLVNLRNCLPTDIINKISYIDIPINNIEDKTGLNFF